MIFAELRDYLQTHHRVALADMVDHFDSDPDALRGMLDKWVAKGRVEKLTLGASCGGCSGCDTAHAEIYQWKKQKEVA